MFALIKSFFAKDPLKAQGESLYAQIVAQARQPRFYTEWGVADSVDGRFDLLLIHAFLVMRRLNAIGPQGQALGQSLFDVMFLDMDRALREMGVGDMSIGKHVKKMAEAFYGRVAMYEAGFLDPPMMEAAIRNNLYRGQDGQDGAVTVLATYIRAQDEWLKNMTDKSLMAGRVAFKPVDDFSVNRH